MRPALIAKMETSALLKVLRDATGNFISPVS